MNKQVGNTKHQAPHRHTGSTDMATFKDAYISPGVLLRVEEVAAHLLTFFSQAGIPAEIEHNWRLRINKDLTRPLSESPAARAGEWRKIADRLAWIHARAEFTWSVLRNLPLPPAIARTDLGRGYGFSISRDGERLAVIHATSASALGQQPFYANFLSYGAHWQQLAESLQIAWHVTPPQPRPLPPQLRFQSAADTREAPGKPGTRTAGGTLPPAARLIAEKPAPPSRQALRAGTRMTQFPDYLQPRTVAACMEASRRIREERQIGYECPVVLETKVGALTFLPLAWNRGQVSIPFSIRLRPDPMSASLLLAKSDPLPLVTDNDVPEDDAAMAWVCALLGFADATCFTFETHGSDRARRHPHPSLSASRYRGLARSVPRKKRWPANLEPTGPTANRSGSIVPGHIRHLPEGQHGGEEAHDYALHHFGIILRDGETWVKTHTRGLTGVKELRFRWHTQIDLRHVTRGRDRTTHPRSR